MEAADKDGDRLLIILIKLKLFNVFEALDLVKFKIFKAKNAIKPQLTGLKKTKNYCVRLKDIFQLTI